MERLGRTGLPFDDWEEEFVEEHGIVQSSGPLMRTPEDIATNMAKTMAHEALSSGRSIRTCHGCPNWMESGKCLVTVEGLKKRNETTRFVPVHGGGHRCDHRLRRIS